MKSVVISKNCSWEEMLFLGGDFNCTENDEIDRNHLEPHAASRCAMIQLVETQADIWSLKRAETLADIWRELSRDHMVSMARLDRFYVFKHHFSTVKACRIVPVGFKDHSMVICNVCIANIKQKSVYWHFNTALLLENNFKETFIFFWKIYQSRKSKFASLKHWWYYEKGEIRQLCQQYTLIR